MRQSKEELLQKVEAALEDYRQQKELLTWYEEQGPDTRKAARLDLVQVVGGEQYDVVSARAERLIEVEAQIPAIRLYVELVEEGIARLSQPEQTLIRLRYLASDGNRRSWAEIARRVSATQVKLRHVRAEALRKMGDYLLIY